MPTRGGWSFASTGDGELSVTLIGTVWLPRWCATSLDTLMLMVGVVSNTSGCGLHTEVHLYGRFFGWCIAFCIWAWIHLKLYTVNNCFTTTETAIAVLNSFYGAGSGLIWFDNVRCRGGEANLLQCTHPPPLSSFCTHFRDAGVVCPGDPIFGHPL